MAALEDKIVQRAAMTVLNSIYEEDFLGFSAACPGQVGSATRAGGFRPGRGPHDALDALAVAITTRKVNDIWDADIRAFFDTVSQAWLVTFLEHRIADRRMLHLIQKWLKVGVLEDGVIHGIGDGHWPGFGDLTAARQRLSPRRVRSVGRALATARGHVTW